MMRDGFFLPFLFCDELHGMDFGGGVRRGIIWAWVIMHTCMLVVELEVEVERRFHDWDACME